MSRPPYDTGNLARHVGDDDEAVTENRSRLLRATGVHQVWAEQVHGPVVAVVSQVSGTVPGADALVTSEPGIALCIQVADCLPILLADPGAGVIAAAHAGRQGLLAGVVQNTVTAMTEQGAAPGRIRALVGPAIGACCYELPPELVDDAADRLPEARGVTRAGTPSMDLRAGAAAVLAAAGVHDVTQVGGCTADDPGLFSYRRDGVTGRQAGVIWRE